MFKKIFEYAGPYKKNMYVATVVVLVSVLMGILPFVLAYQVISPLVIGDSVETEFVLLRVIGVLICLVLQAFFYGWGLSISHKAAYNTLFRLRVSLQKKFEILLDHRKPDRDYQSLSCVLTERMVSFATSPRISDCVDLSARTRTVSSVTVPRTFL